MRTSAKALLAAVLAGLTALATGLTDDHLTAAEWVAAAVATVTAGGAVWRVPNESARALLRRRAVADALRAGALLRRRAAAGARRPAGPLVDRVALRDEVDRRYEADDPQG